MRKHPDLPRNRLDIALDLDVSMFLVRSKSEAGNLGGEACLRESMPVRWNICVVYEYDVFSQC